MADANAHRALEPDPGPGPEPDPGPDPKPDLDPNPERDISPASDSTRYPPDSSGYRSREISSASDSTRYPSDSSGYRSPKGDTDAHASDCDPEESGRDESSVDADAGSYCEDDEEALPDWLLAPAPAKPPHVQRLESARWVPGKELGIERLFDDGLYRYSRRSEQVNVRLRSVEMERLRRAADLYGISPTAMARVFINRGARTVLEEWLRDERIISPRNP